MYLFCYPQINGHFAYKDSHSSLLQCYYRAMIYEHLPAPADQADKLVEVALAHLLPPTTTHRVVGRKNALRQISECAEFSINQAED